MDVKNQLAFFLLSVVIGVIGGIFYGVFHLLRKICGCDKGKCKALGIALDVACGIIFAIWCIYASFLFNLPYFRAYMCLGWAIGGIIYLKILQIMLAFLKKVCYNVYVKMVKKAKSKEKTLKKR